MRLTSREIINSWLEKKRNLACIELALQLEFGSLKYLVTHEGPAEPEMDALLNIVNNHYWLVYTNIG